MSDQPRSRISGAAALLARVLQLDLEHLPQRFWNTRINLLERLRHRPAALDRRQQPRCTRWSSIAVMKSGFPSEWRWMSGARPAGRSPDAELRRDVFGDVRFPQAIELEFPAQAVHQQVLLERFERAFRENQVSWTERPDE